MKKQEVRRMIELVGLDKYLKISKATAVKTDKQMIHLDQLEDGTWRLIYNANLIPDFTKVEALRIVRDDRVACYAHELPQDLVDAVANAKMDPKFDHLNDLLKD